MGVVSGAGSGNGRQTMNRNVLIGLAVVILAGLGYYQFSYVPAQRAAAEAAAENPPRGARPTRREDRPATTARDPMADAPTPPRASRPSPAESPKVGAVMSSTARP